MLTELLLDLVNEQLVPSLLLGAVSVVVVSSALLSSYPLNLLTSSPSASAHSSNSIQENENSKNLERIKANDPFSPSSCWFSLWDRLVPVSSVGPTSTSSSSPPAPTPLPSSPLSFFSSFLPTSTSFSSTSFAFVLSAAPNLPSFSSIVTTTTSSLGVHSVWQRVSGSMDTLRTSSSSSPSLYESQEVRVNSTSTSITTSSTTISTATSTSSTTTTTTSLTASGSTSPSRVSKAKLLRLGSSMSLAVPLALTRRVWKGAAYSSWSVGFEVQVEMGQALLRNHHRLSLADLRQLSVDYAADPPANQSTIRTVYCGGVRADLIQYRSPHAVGSPSRRASLPVLSSSAGAPTARTLRQEIASKSLHEAEAGDPRDESETKARDGERAQEKKTKKTLSSLAKPSSAAAAVKSASLGSSASAVLISKSPKTTPAVCESADSVSTRVKTHMPRSKSESDNLGRMHEFQAGQEAGEEDDVEAAATVLYLHGGGFCVGSATTYRKCLWHFSREMKGLRFLAVDYSLSPDVRFPTALHECLHAYLWLIDENGGNVPPEKVILAGDSAGGCLVLALLFLIREMRDEAMKSKPDDHPRHSEEEQLQEESPKEERSEREASFGGEEEAEVEEESIKAEPKTKLPFPLPSRKTPPAFPLCAFLVSPWVDLSADSSVMKQESYKGQYASSYESQMALARRFIEAYLGIETDAADAKNATQEVELKDMKTTGNTGPDVRSPFISPLYGDLHGLPPMLLTAGGEEPLLADIEALYARCVEADVDVEIDIGEHMNHAYQVFHEPSAHREVERSLQAIGRFVWRHIAQRQLSSD